MRLALPTISDEAKALIIAAGGILALVAIVATLWFYDPFGRRKHAEAVATAATTQSHVDKAVVTAVDHYTDHVTVIHEKANAAVDQIQHAPTADQPLDPGFRAQLCASLAGVRDGPVCADDQPPK